MPVRLARHPTWIGYLDMLLGDPGAEHDMEIGTDTTALSALNALLPSMSTTASSAFGSSSFGPASILSLGESSIPMDDTYSNLAGVFGAQQSGILSQNSQQLTNSEIEALEDAFDLIENGAFDAAEEVLSDLLAKNNNNAAAIHASGLIESFKGNHEDAERLFLRADFLAPGRGYGEDAQDARILAQDDDAVFDAASKLLNSSSTQKRGISLLMRLSDRRPDHGETQILLAENLFATNDVFNGLSYAFSAIEVADQVELQRLGSLAEDLIERLPSAPQFHRLLGRVQVRLGEFEDALATLDIAASLADTDAFTRTDAALAHVGIGRKLLDQGAVSRALVNFDQADALDPTNIEVREALGEGYLAQADRSRRLGNLPQAITAYSKAARALGSAGSDSLRTRIAGGAYAAGLKLEQRHEAAGDDIDEEALAFQAAYDLDPDNASYRRKLAQIRNDIGSQFLAEEDYAQAIAAYRRAYELDHNNDTYKDNLSNAYVLRGDEALARLDYAGAIDAYRGAYELDQYDEVSKTKLAEVYNTRGLDYINKDKPIQAAKDFKEALALFPDNAEYQSNYASVEAYDN